MQALDDADGEPDVVTFALQSDLPPGMALNQTTGQIEGSTMHTGAYVVTVIASGSKLFCSIEIVLEVAPPLRVSSLRRRGALC